VRGTWPIVPDVLDTHRVAQDFPIGLASAAAKSISTSMEESMWEQPVTFGVFRFWSLDLGNAGDHITQGGLSRSYGPAFLLERLFGREDSSLIL
jgi:hypothetical protein